MRIIENSFQKTIKMQEINIGISLSGGVVRGIAHIGVLQALEEENIFPSHISGSSIGSIVGVLYAAGNSPQQLLEIAKNTSLFNLFRPQLSLGLMELSQVTKILKEYIKVDDFNILKKKFYVCVTNLESGEWEIREKGVLFQSVIASCSIPFVFKPIELDGQMYVDGGVLNNLPIEPLKEVCDKVIGVNVIPVGRSKKLDGIVDIAKRSAELILNSNSSNNMAKCDIALNIDGINEFDFFDFNKTEELYELGYQVTKSKMKMIKEVLNIK